MRRGPVLAFPEPGDGVGQCGELGEQGEELLVLVAADEPGRGQQHRRGAQPLTGLRRCRYSAPQLAGGPVVFAGGGGQQAAAAAFDDPCGGSEEI